MSVRNAELNLQALMQAGELAQKQIREWPEWKQQAARAVCGFTLEPDSSEEHATSESRRAGTLPIE